jgi:hypothetical protein
MDQRRALSRFIERQATGTVILGGKLHGWGDRDVARGGGTDSVGGLVLTGSVYPWARGGWPHPLVITGFAAYDIPRWATAWWRRALRHLSAARLVRMGYRMCTADPSTIPPDESPRPAWRSSRNARRIPTWGRRSLDAWRSMRRLGKRPDIAKRAMDEPSGAGARDARAPGWLVPVRVRRGRLAHASCLARAGSSPTWATCRRWRRPDGRLAEVADWYAEALD